MRARNGDLITLEWANFYKGPICLKLTPQKWSSVWRCDNFHGTLSWVHWIKKVSPCSVWTSSTRSLTETAAMWSWCGDHRIDVMSHLNPRTDLLMTVWGSCARLTKARHLRPPSRANWPPSVRLRPMAPALKWVPKLGYCFARNAFVTIQM